MFTIRLIPNRKHITATLVMFAIAFNLPKKVIPQTEEATFAMIGHEKEVRAVAFSIDGMIVASGSHDKTIKLWDSKTGKLLRTLKRHKDTISSIKFWPDGRIMSSTSWDNTVILWDTQTWKPIRTLSLVQYGPVISGNSKTLAFWSDKEVRLWDLQTGDFKQTSLTHDGNNINSLSISPDGNLIATGSGIIRRSLSLSEIGPPKIFGEFRIWNNQTDELLRKMEFSNELVSSLSYSPDGTMLAIGSVKAEEGVFIGQVKICNPNTGDLIRTMEWRWGGSAYMNASIAFSSDSKVIASSGLDAVVRVWDTNTGEQKVALQSPQSGGTAFIFSPLDDIIATWGAGNEVFLWKAQSGELKQKFTGHSNRVISVAFSSDGKFLTSCGEDKTVRLWRISE